MDGLIVQVMEHLGLWGVVFLMFLENVFPPIPSEVIMTSAGFAAQNGLFPFYAVVAAGTLGSVLGAIPLYYLGQAFDKVRLMSLVVRFGRYALLKPADVTRALDWFDRYGKAVVFFGRMVPAVRSLISIPAGMARMPLMPFLALTAVGSALWTGFLAYAGLILGANYAQIETYISPISKAVLLLVVLTVLVFLTKRLIDIRSNSNSR